MYLKIFNLETGDPLPGHLSFLQEALSDILTEKKQGMKLLLYT